MDTVKVGGGINFVGLLTIVFITLKLTHFIDWNWWWVLSPMWIPMAVIIGLFVLFMGGVLAGKGAIWVYEKLTGK
jgi:hypothetical protein